MFKKILPLSLMLLFAVAFSTSAQELPEGLNCVVAGRPAKAAAAADYRGGKVYLCCKNCVAKFSGDSSPFATLANQQLVKTEQFEQTACPISGGKLNEEQFVEVDGVKVHFCCGNCKGKVESAEDDGARRELVFGDKAFDKGFVQKKAYDITGLKCFMMPKRDVKEAKSVEHRDGKVFFCCPGCVKKWNKDPAKYEEMANLQLVASGQFEQTACPISGGDVDEEQFSEVDGVKVHFCCGNCKGKVESTGDPAAKRALVFGEKTFAKGFSKK